MIWLQTIGLLIANIAKKNKKEKQTFTATDDSDCQTSQIQIVWLPTIRLRSLEYRKKYFEIKIVWVSWFMIKGMLYLATKVGVTCLVTVVRNMYLIFLLHRKHLYYFKDELDIFIFVDIWKYFNSDTCGFWVYEFKADAVKTMFKTCNSISERESHAF